MTAAQGGRVFDAARIDDLAPALAVIDRACDEAGASDAEQHDLRLAVEEVFTNICRHGYGGQAGPIELRVDIDARRACVQLLDRAPDFDPANAAAPALDAELDQRPIGGLGWHLVRQLMHEVHRAPRPGGGNAYTLVRARAGAFHPD